jgi:hypothetical protein
VKRFVILCTVALLSGAFGLLRGTPAAFAFSSSALSIGMTSDPHLSLDSNKPCVQGADAAYVEFTVTNTTAGSLSNLTATLGGLTTGFSLGGGDTAARSIGTLAAGASVNEYWFITYSCTAGMSDTLSVTVSDGNGSSSAGTGTVATYSSISAQAGGNVQSATISASTYQSVSMDVTYSFGSVSAGDEFDFQPAGNTSFNGGCFRLTGSQILSSQATAVPANGTQIYYTASANQGGTNHLVSVRYFFTPQCVGIATTAEPYALQTSGNTNVKYSGNFGVTVSVPATVANTAVAVSSSLNSSTYGQSVTFTATISRTPNSGVAGGTVTFVADSGTINQQTLCSAATVGAAGTATCSVSTLTAGTHTITANYSGDSADSSSSGTLSGGQTVNKANTTTTVVPSVNPSTFGQSVTFTATVTPTSSGAAAAANPTGTVTFYDGSAATGTQLGQGTLSTTGGVTTATLSVSTLSVAGSPHTITAVYGGDTNYSGSSGTTSETVNGMPTTTGVTSSKNPANAGTTITFTATVSQSTNLTSTPVGTIQFYDGTVDSAHKIGSAQTLSGSANSATASVQTAALTVGTHPIIAVYTPSSVSFSASDNSASPYSQEIDPLPTISLDSASDSATAGDRITNINKPQFDGTAMKGVSVTVLDGSTPYCTAQASATTGAWSCSGTTALSDGLHSVTASAANPGGAALSSPLSVRIDVAVASMAVTAAGTTQTTLGIQDGNSGLANITITKCVNCTYTVNNTKNPGTAMPDPYSLSGQTTQLPVTFTRIDNSQPATLSLTSTDVAGNVGDPSVLYLGRSAGSQVAATVRDVEQQESEVDVLNATPGIQTLTLNVNGKLFQYRNLVSGQKLVIAIGSALRPGNANQITAVGVGPKGSTATLFIGPPHQ